MTPTAGDRTPPALVDRAPATSDPGDHMVEGHHPSIVQYVTSQRLATDYDRTFDGNALFLTDTRFLDDVLPPPPARVIDLGCGTGRHALHLARQGYAVTALDLSEHMLEIARSKLAAEGLEANVLRGDICDLSRFAPGEFDAAVCMFSTLGLVRGGDLRRRALAEARRVLRPGGLYCCHVHNRLRNLTHTDGAMWMLRNTIDAALGRCDAGDRLMPRYRGQVDLYLHLFTRGELSRLISAAGFQTVRALCLNAPRTGELAGRWASIRSNGFILAARRDDENLGESNG